MGLWGAQCVAMWGATTWVTGVRPSPLLGPLCNPSSRPWRLQVGVTPGGGPQVPHTPRGLLGGLWVAWKAALPLKSPLVASLIAKGTTCCWNEKFLLCAKRRVPCTCTRRFAHDKNFLFQQESSKRALTLSGYSA